MASMHTPIRRFTATVILVLIASLGGPGNAHAAADPLPPLHAYVATTGSPTTGSTWVDTTVLWELPSAPMGYGALLGYLEVPFSNHNALTLLPLHASARSWTITGRVDDVWEVSPTNYAILVHTEVHTPPNGFPIMKEVLGLDLHNDSLTPLWIYRGKININSDSPSADGTACGVVIAWHGQHISLRAVPGYGGYTNLALFAGTNTCK